VIFAVLELWLYRPDSEFKTSQFLPIITIMAKRAKFTYAYYTIQDEGGSHIDFRQMSTSPGQTTANNCKTAFSLHVVESASDDYNF